VYRERTYTPGVYATAAQRIVEAYRERGYLDATVSTPVVARVETPSGPRLDVTFHVTEGPCSLIEEITFTGNRAQPSAALAEALGLRLGVPVSYRGLGDARVRLADWYHERGYAFASVEPAVERSPDHTRARVRVVVHEGPRVRIGRVEVRGNAVTRESVVRTRLALREGDAFSLSALRTSQRQLYELGVFTSVNVGLLDGDIEATVKTLLVQVVEDRRFSLEVRGGFSFGQGARAAVEAALINIGGVGMSLTVRPEVGYLLALPFVAPEPPTGINVGAWDAERLTGRAPLSLGFPHIPGLGPRFSASVDLVASRQLQPWSYSLVTLGLGGTLTWRPISRLSLSFTGELQRIDVGLFGQGSIDETLRRIYEDCINEGVPMTTCNQRRLAQRQNLLRYEPGRSDLAAARVGIVWDGRDNPLTPRSGFYASLTTELLSLLSFDQAASALRPADTTLHMEGRITGYIPVGSVVVAMSARAGRNFTLGGADRTHPSRLFWLGGANSMRGWTQNQLLPQDTIDEARAAPPELRDSVLAGVQGGEFYLNAVLDIRVPLGLCVLAGVCVELGFFADVGNVWRRAPSEVADWFNLRVSPGAGLRFTSPVGIIAFDFGLALPYYAELGESVFQTMQFYLGNTL
jgi:outer membrane protein assembly factor BamA